MRDEQERFWSKVAKGPDVANCWIWTGTIGDDGYGRFWTSPAVGRQKMIRAHRYALGLVHGGLDTIADLQACHVCDNPICVRVELDGVSHVYLGTRESNMMDRADRGRHNLQFAAAFFRHQSPAERGRRSRALRDVIRDKGYDREAIKAMMLGLARGQGTLF